MVRVLGSVSQDEEAASGVQGGNGEDADEYEDSGEDVGKVELNEMLQVKEETVPSTLAVGVARNGHESIGHGVKVLNQTLKARNKAPKKATNQNNNCISLSLLV